MSKTNRLPLALLLLRLGVFVVMFIWTIDKFVRPEHAAKIFAEFYFIGGLGNLPVYMIGATELVILLGFLAGIQEMFHSQPAFLCRVANAGGLFHAIRTPASGFPGRAR